MYYSIFLEDFTVTASIGIHDFERRAKQRLILNLSLLLKRSDASEDIESVVDYDFLRDGIHAIIEDRHFNLQETLCETIIEMCMSKSSVYGVKISSEKPDVYEDCAAVGCRMQKARADISESLIGQFLKV